MPESASSGAAKATISQSAIPHAPSAGPEILPLRALAYEGRAQRRPPASVAPSTEASTQCNTIFAVSNIPFQLEPVPDSLRRFKADIFQALAHPTRIAIMELLGEGELSAGDLMERLGIEQANISQHLAVLRSKQLVWNRKAGNQVFYSVRDPIVNQVLALMRLYFQRRLIEAREMLDEINDSAPPADPSLTDP
jgi:ArsR family transcriptional regulator